MKKIDKSIVEIKRDAVLKINKIKYYCNICKSDIKDKYGNIISDTFNAKFHYINEHVFEEKHVIDNSGNILYKFSSKEDIDEFCDYYCFDDNNEPGWYIYSKYPVERFYEIDEFLNIKNKEVDDIKSMLYKIKNIAKC